jgi:hypothetical protein
MNLVLVVAEQSIKNATAVLTRANTCSQEIWAIGLIGKWVCIWYDLSNPNNGINLVPNRL